MKTTWSGIISLSFILLFILTITCFVNTNSALAADSISFDVSVNIDATTGEYVFDIDVKGVADVRKVDVAVASYDTYGTCRQKTIISATEVPARLPFDTQAVSYKAMLLDSTILLKPLCPSKVGALESWDYTKKITIMSEHVKRFDEETHELYYYPDNYNVTKYNTIKLEESLNGVIYNDCMEYDFGDLSAIMQDTDVILEFEDTDSDMMYDKISATQYTYDIVEDIDLSKNKLTLRNISSLYLPDESEDVTMILTDSSGKEISLSDIAQGDVLAMIADDERINRYKDYIKIVKVLDSKVKGTVDECYPLVSLDCIVIDEKEYVDISGQNISAGDEGVFYIGLTGKIFCYDMDYDALNYGYVLEGKCTQTSFSGDKWSFRILTENGDVITCEATDSMNNEDYVSSHPNAFNVVDNEFLFADATDKEKKNQARFVTYTLNSQGKISMDIAESGSYYKISKDSTYDSSNNTLGTYKLKKQITVYDVSGGVLEAFTTDISHLKELVGYSGFVFANPIERLHSVVVITDINLSYEVKLGFAVVTRVDDAGNGIVTVSYAQNEAEGELTLDYDDKSVCSNSEKLELAMGDVFVYTADSAGLVSDFTIIARVAKEEKTGDITGFSVLENFDTNAEKLGKDTEIFSGYIFNEKFRIANGREIIYLDCDYGFSVVVPQTSYKYTYCETGRQDEVIIGDFIHDVELREDIVDDSDDVIGYLVCPILFRVVDGVVEDVYSLTARHEYMLE